MREREKERAGKRGPDVEDDAVAAFSVAIADDIANDIVADVRCFRCHYCCCCLQMLLLFLHHVVGAAFAIIAFPSKFRAQIS